MFFRSKRNWGKNKLPLGMHQIFLHAGSLRSKCGFPVLCVFQRTYFWIHRQFMDFHLRNPQIPGFRPRNPQISLKSVDFSGCSGFTLVNQQISQKLQTWGLGLSSSKVFYTKDQSNRRMTFIELINPTALFYAKLTLPHWSRVQFRNILGSPKFPA